jgi:adenosylcobinamide kinase/adenosylcobinamide-phosphate guanylyltransferase
MRNGKLIFISGGARSGKSTFAEELAESFNKDVAYIATFKKDDDPEMTERIKRHKETRPGNWKTLEIEDIDNIILHIKKNKIRNSVIIIECLTILASNLLMKKADNSDKIIMENIRELVDFIKNDNQENIFVVVSNEVGQGIVPGNEIARKYRDILGKANQMMAKNADEFYVMFSGIPVDAKKLKYELKF